MRTITDILKLAQNDNLVGDDIATNLTESEGQKGSQHVNSTGHALQHISVLHKTAPGKFSQLKTTYHKRGPMRYHGVSGDIVPLGGPDSHSQFKDEGHACSLIAMALSTKGGIRAMKLLKDASRTIKLEVGFAPGMTLIERTSHVVQKDDLGRGAFVLIDKEQLSGVVLELHNSSRTLEGLHFQSAYPTKQGGPAAGKAKITVTTHGAGGKTSAEYNVS